MKMNKKGGMNTMLINDKGKVGWILLWLLGIPLPILLVFYLLRGCT
jgi:hypothetical protein